MMPSRECNFLCGVAIATQSRALMLAPFLSRPSGKALAFGSAVEDLARGSVLSGSRRSLASVLRATVSRVGACVNDRLTMFSMPASASSASTAFPQHIDVLTPTHEH